MNDSQIIAAIATTVEYMKSPVEPDVSMIARSYRANLRIASQPKNPDELTIEDMDRYLSKIAPEER